MNITALDNELQVKLQNIKLFFENKKIVVAFSGGVDSTVVMELAHQFSLKAIAVTADSITILPGEVEKATELALERGYEHRIYQINELEDENFAKNPNNRCYYCKSGLADILKVVAVEIDADLIVEGTNITEISGHRPGLEAIKENNIKSPLLDFGLTKSEIRELATYFKLSNAQKPSLACLSSRFPTGIRITPEKLIRVGKAENYLISKYNIQILRVRDHEGLARIEISPDERHKILNEKVLDDIFEKFTEFGFNFVTIDCRGYKTGSLSEMNNTISDGSKLLSTNDIEII